MSAPAHVKLPLSISTEGVHHGVDIRDSNGMLVACVFGKQELLLSTAQAMAAGPELLASLQEVLAAQRISSRAPDTVAEAEAKLDLIRKAAVRANAAIAAATGGTS